MLIYVVTREPYHDNSTLLGVFLDLGTGMAVLKASVTDASNVEYDNSVLVEWDTVSNSALRRWAMALDEDNADEDDESDPVYYHLEELVEGEYGPKWRRVEIPS